MALTRKSLKAMGLTEEQVDSIVEMHTEVKDELKQQLKDAQEKADKYEGVKKELDELKAKSTDDFEQKYNDEHKAFEEYKTQIANEKAYEVKKSSFIEAAKKAKVSDKRINSIVRLEKEYISNLKLDKDNKVKDTEAVEKFIKDNYDEYIVKSRTEGANTETPPANNGKGITKEEILAIKDTAARQKAMAEHSDLFGI